MCLCNGAEFTVPLTAEIEQRQIQGMQFLRQLRLMPERGVRQHIRDRKSIMMQMLLYPLLSLNLIEISKNALTIPVIQHRCQRTFT